MRRALPMLLVFACGLAVPASAATPSAQKLLWATVNVCNTQTHPDMIGVRASMPGDGDRTKMYMRFAAQYYSPSKQLWFDVGQNGLSNWIYVGSGIYRAKQAGYTFAFDAPTNGNSFTLRGAVDFKWVKKGHLVRTAHVVTHSGHPNTTGADPADFSASLCEITSS
jgi:hypothetical protein